MNRVEALLRKAIGLDAGTIGRTAIERTARLRMKSLGLKKVEDYLHLLESSPAEHEELVESVVVAETWFFRDRDAYAALAHIARETSIPAPGQGVMRLLSVPCSTGEEPLTLAMLLDERGALAAVEIVASDISARSIKRAQSGKFRVRSVRDPAPERLVSRYLQRKPDEVSIEPRLIEHVTWKQLNLLDRVSQAALGVFDAIVCRNVLIYFAQDRIARVVRSLLDRLVSDGVLLVGISESLFRIDADLLCEERRGIFSYRIEKAG